MAAKLKLIDGSAPPRPLGKHGRALWSSICRAYDISDACGVEMLAQACAALERAEQCAELIASTGEAGVTPGGIVKENPLMKVELANRSFVVRTLERLGLNSEPAKANGRPPQSWSQTHEKTETAQQKNSHR